MKFSKKRYIILDDIGDKGIKISPGLMTFINQLGEDEEFVNDAFDSFAHTVINQASKVYYLSSEISEEFGSPSLAPKLYALRHELNSTSGTILLPAKGLFNVFNSISYITERTELLHQFSICLYSTRGSEVFITGHFEGEKYKAISMVPSDADFFKGKDFLIDSTITYLFNLLLFLQFAEVETIEIKGSENNRPVKIRVNKEKYLSESPVPIEIIDSNWFKSIIRIGAFKVSGHFRLQPHGVNNSLRKLVWISEFNKEGYKRKAKKDSFGS